jgi:WD40 repeat protein
MRYFAILLCVLVFDVARADELPLLQLDTGGHMATIRGIAFTADGKQLVSAGDDKVIRVWDLASGKTVRTIRGESAVGTPGKIFAMALSLDGKWLAIGGDLGTETAQTIRLYDFESGKLVALVNGHTGVIRALAFSADGNKLISGSSDKTAIIWDTRLQSGVQVPEPKLLHRLEGHKADIFAVAFSPDGSRAVTGSYDKDLRLWQVSDGSQIALMADHGDKVMSLAFAPNGTIASGDLSGAILLWDGRYGSFLRVLAQQKIGAGSLSFSLNGKLLVSTCGFGDCSGALGYVYDVASGQQVASYSGHDNAVFASAFSPDGRWVATGGGANNEIHLWDPHTGQRRLGPHGQPLRLGGQGQAVWAAGFSADGRKIGWGNVDACPNKPHCPNGQIILQHALTLPLGDATLGAPVALTERDANTFRHASPSFDGWSLTHREGGNYGYDNAILDILKAGHVVASITRQAINGLAHHAYSFAPDGETIISGGSFGVITAYDREGKTLGAFVGHEGKVFAVVPSPDGRYLVSGSADETVRLWNLKTRELLVSLFQGTDGEWVMWIPQGYYASSPNGDTIMGWQINKGPDQAAEYVTASQLRKQFYRPDIVERAIVVGSAIRALEETGRARATTFQLSDLTKRLPPKLSQVLAPKETMRGRAGITLALVESKDDPVKDFDVFVNDTKVTATTQRQGPDISFDVPLAQGTNKIRVVARSKTELLGEANLQITQNGEGALDKRDNLFIVAVGVDQYPNLPKTCGPMQNASCNLAFAGADAKSFADAIETQMGQQHRQVVKRVLFNGAGGKMEPTRDNIENAFDLLLKSEDNDTIAVFIAGHGYNDRRTGYQFLPTNVQVGESGNWASSSIIKWATLESTIEAAKGRRLLFVDTCHSGGAYNARLIKDATDDAIVAFTATNTQQEALELTSLGHGAFTHVVVRGIKGEADLAHENEVRVFDLGAFVEREVRKLTNGHQTPDFYKKPGAENFVLVRM